MKKMMEKLKAFRNILKMGTSMLFRERAHILKGELFLKLYENGKLIQVYNNHNIIVNTASILIARLLF